MQTFITDFDLEKSAKNLDNKRLGKQRIEAIQIAKILIEGENYRWKNHPAVLMWKGYEAFLVKKYIKAILKEWNSREFSNTKSLKDYRRLYRLVFHMEIIKPDWITAELIKSHRSKLIQKHPDYYKKIWPDIPDNLEYIWPRRISDDKKTDN